MNWIERMYELKGKDPYSQNGEGIYLEYISHHIGINEGFFFDIGSGDEFHLSNTRHLRNLGWKGVGADLINGYRVTTDNIRNIINIYLIAPLLSIDIDGNDYWIIDAALQDGSFNPKVIIAEFNAAFSDSRTIKYNPDHVWDGTDYYGFSFEAGKKLFEKHGYKVIFNVANMNMIAVREDLIKVAIPTVTYEVTQFFEKSVDREWVFI